MTFRIGCWKMTRALVWLVVVCSCVAVPISWALATGSTVGISPIWTYLYVPSNEPPGAVDAVPIELALLGIAAGDTLRLEQLGTFNNGPAGDTLGWMIGVFSGSDVLLASTLRYRVQDAIEAGTDFITGDAYWDGQPTDIPEDFWIDDVVIVVPPGATHLFVTPYDTGYWDNSDPNGDFAVRLSVVYPSLSGIPDNDSPLLSRLEQNVPNPFNPTTTVAYEAINDQHNRLTVHDLGGRLVRVLVDEMVVSSGRQEVVWNGRDANGRTVSAGVYFYRLEAGSFSETKRMVLIK